MKFISLMDTHNQNVISVDRASFVLRLEIDSISKEIRLKPFMASLLYEIFSLHPEPLSYDKITAILRGYDLVITDLTRMHRKISEIRQVLQSFHPSLASILQNARGVGYSLPMHFKNLHQIGPEESNQKFATVKLSKAIKSLQSLIEESIDMTQGGAVTKHFLGFVMKQENAKNRIVKDLQVFEECEKTILKEISLHPADLISLRVNYLLAKLKTYIGQARISEYCISQAQWVDWFEQEVWMLFEELKNLIRLAQ